jgi:hypothetical protein
VFREGFRVFTLEGRLANSDIVAIGNMPAAIGEDPTAFYRLHRQRPSQNWSA